MQIDVCRSLKAKTQRMLFIKQQECVFGPTKQTHNHIFKMCVCVLGILSLTRQRCVYRRVGLDSVERLVGGATVRQSQPKERTPRPNPTPKNSKPIPIGSDPTLGIVFGHRNIIIFNVLANKCNCDCRLRERAGQID